MSVHDARPADVYVDGQGKLWRCVGVIREPSVIFEEIERTDGAAAQVRISGGVSGYMWTDFIQVYRPAQNEAREGALSRRATTNLPPALLKGEPE